MNKIKDCLAFGYLVAFLVGCVALPSESPTSTITVPITTIQSIPIMQTATITPSPSPTVATPFRPVSTDTEEVIPICPSAGEPVVSPDFGIPGTIVYQTSQYYGLYTIGGTSLNQSHLPVDKNQEFSFLGFSPDGTWLAYVPLLFVSPETRTLMGEVLSDTLSVVLLSANGETIEHSLDIQHFESELPVANQLTYLYSNGWINDHLIYVVFYVQNPDPTTTQVISLLPIVLNPFDGIWEERLITGLPNRYNSGPIGFAPDMSRVFYITKGGDVVLRDLSNETESLIEMDFYSSPDDVILWSPDGSMAVIANRGVSPSHRRGFIVSPDRMVENIIIDSISPSSGFQLGDIKWSPDGRYLALVNMYGIVDDLYLYDTSSDVYLYRCPLTEYTDTYPRLVWSPDSLHIAISGQSAPMHILNIQTGEVNELLPDAIAVGWSDRFPVVWP